jgi:hypothetical protein
LAKHFRQRVEACLLEGQIGQTSMNFPFIHRGWLGCIPRTLTHLHQIAERARQIADNPP